MPDEKRIDLEESLTVFSLSSFTGGEDLKRRYRQLIMRFHPDKNPDRIEWSTRILQEVNQAYESLRERIRRAPEQQHPLGPEELIRYGDWALRDAIVTGWLKRVPRTTLARMLRRKLMLASEELGKLDAPYPYPKGVVEYCKTLFFVFLRATDMETPKPFPTAKNTTRFFRHLSIANGYLDSGIRHFYRYRENRTIVKFSNIPLSFLGDALRLYSFLIPVNPDREHLSLIQARMELASLFQMRILDPSLVGI